jgi:hypothetical protein
MELQTIEKPGQIAEDAGRLADQLRILENLDSIDVDWTDKSEVQNLHGVFKKIDTELGKLKLSCLSICLTNSRNHHSGAILHMLDELTQLSGQLHNVIERPPSIPETSAEGQTKLMSNQKLFVETEHCLKRISRMLYDWR